MIDSLKVYDYILFQKINKEWVNPFSEKIFPFITDLHKNTIFVYIILPLLLIFWLRRDRMRAVTAMLGLVLVVGTTDNLNHRIIKPYFNRDRPAASGMEPIVRSETNTGLSFPSNHAANVFAAAHFLNFYYPGTSLLFGSAAVLIAYSRVYVGAHFPLDVVGGAIVGLLVAIFYRILWRQVAVRWNARQRTKQFESYRYREDIYKKRG